MPTFTRAKRAILEDKIQVYDDIPKKLTHAARGRYSSFMLNGRSMEQGAYSLSFYYLLNFKEHKLVTYHKPNDAKQCMWEYMGYDFTTLNIVIFTGEIFHVCVTQMLRVVAIYAILTSMPLYLCHGIISAWGKFSRDSNLQKFPCVHFLLPKCYITWFQTDTTT